LENRLKSFCASIFWNTTNRNRHKRNNLSNTDIQAN
jgi:hypothetical protein